jgi:hypothetical protein
MASQLVDKKDVNVVSSMNLKTIRPINKNAIPLGRGRGRSVNLQNLQVVRDFNLLLDRICSEGISPYEVAGEICTDDPDIQAEMKRRKSFNQSFRSVLKECVKKHGLKDKIDVLEFDHGKKFYILGRTI